MWKRIGVLMVSLAALAGCVAETETGEVGLAQGLTVLDFTDTSISLAFRDADEVIYMESARGLQVPEYYRNDPRTIPYEMDARFTDEDGYIFYIQQGGHDFVHPEWEEAMNRQLTDETPVIGSNENDFRLASLASQTLFEDVVDQLGEELAAQLEPEVESIFRFASIAHEHFVERNEARLNAIREKGIEDGAVIEIPTEDGDVTYGTPGPEDPYYRCKGSASYQIRLHADDLEGISGYAGGWHSSTSRTWSNGSSTCGATLSTHNTCNHGRCGTNMPDRGGSSFQFFNGYGLNAYHCSGDYKWDSDGGSGGHNCHDDSRIQMHNYVYQGAARHRFRWCDGGDRDHDISVDVWGVELDQSGYPRYSSSSNRGWGSEGGAGTQCDYTLGCPSYYMGVGDGCDCTNNGTSCGDPDCN